MKPWSRFIRPYMTILMVGYWHFDNIKTGIAAATLYLLLPYTALLTGVVDHVLPAALLIWAIVAYRRPLISGMLIGLAFGVIYYPAYLLPLWVGFYWRRGLLRFSLGVLSTGLAALIYFRLLISAGPIFASTINYLIPAIGVVLGVVWLGERLALGEFAAFAMIVAGIALARPQPVPQSS